MEKRRLLGGVWKTTALFNAVSFPGPSGDLKHSDYQLQMASAKRWIATYPDPATARIAFPSTDSHYSSFARGTGDANRFSALFTLR
jgi:hypothetical protein